MCVRIPYVTRHSLLTQLAQKFSACTVKAESHCSDNETITTQREHTLLVELLPQNMSTLIQPIEGVHF